MANPGTELATLDFGNLIGGPLVAVITAQSLAAEATANFIKTVGFYPAGQKDADGNDIGGTPIYVDFKYPKETQPYQPKVEAVAGVDAQAPQGDPAFASGMRKPDASNGDLQYPDGTWTNDQKAAMTANDGSHANGIPPYTAAVAAVIAVEGKDAVDAKYQQMQISVPILTMLPIPFIKVDIITIDFNAKITSTETASSSSDLSVSGTVSGAYGTKQAHVAFSGTVAYKKSTTSGSSVERTYSMAIHVQASQDEMPAGMEKLLNILEGAMISAPVKPAPALPST
jgi:hypothetical protein